LALQHGERETVGPPAGRDGGDASRLVFGVDEPMAVGGEVVVVAGQAASQLDDGFSQQTEPSRLMCWPRRRCLPAESYSVGTSPDAR
jgi:hypothetical protein